MWTGVATQNSMIRGDMYLAVETTKGPNWRQCSAEGANKTMQVYNIENCGRKSKRLVFAHKQNVIASGNGLSDEARGWDIQQHWALPGFGERRGVAKSQLHLHPSASSLNFQCSWTGTSLLGFLHCCSTLQAALNAEFVAFPYMMLLY